MSAGKCNNPLFFKTTRLLLSPPSSSGQTAWLQECSPWLHHWPLSFVWWQQWAGDDSPLHFTDWTKCRMSRTRNNSYLLTTDWSTQVNNRWWRASPNKSKHLSVPLVVKMKEVPNIEALGWGGGVEGGWGGEAKEGHIFTRTLCIHGDRTSSTVTPPPPPPPPAVSPPFICSIRNKGL